MRRAILIQQHSLQCIYTTKLICLLVSPSLLENVNACCRYQRQCSCCASSVQVLQLSQPSFIQYLSLSRSNIQVKHSAVFIADILGRDSTWPPSQGRIDCCYFTHCNHAGAFKYNPEVIASSKNPFVFVFEDIHRWLYKHCFPLLCIVIVTSA